MTADIEATMLDLWDGNQRYALLEGDDYAPGTRLTLFEALAQQLAAQGDPRGELILHDLDGTDDPEQRERLLEDWLGAELARDPAVTSRYGLLALWLDDTRSLDVLGAVLDGPGGAYLERVQIAGSLRTIRASLERLCEDGHGWLGNLAISLRGTAAVAEPVVPPELADELVRATPRLHTLEIRGSNLLVAFPHPALLRLVVDGHDTLGALAFDDAPLPELVELDLAFHRHGDRWADVHRAGTLLPAAGFPALRRLDLSRNAPGLVAPRHLGGRTSPFEVLRGIGCRAQLTHVLLPALRTAADADHLQAALSTMPSLVQLRVTGSYGPRRELAHPTAELVIPPTRPWLPPDEAAQLAVTLGDGEHVVDLTEAASVMERRFDALSERARAAWTQVWNAVRGADRVPVTVLAQAVASCSDQLVSDGWRRLAERLFDVEVTASGTVRIARRLG